MKQLLLLLFFICSLRSVAQIRPFRFAFLSDTHIGSSNGGAEEDLRRAVADINNMKDVDFVVLTGDITELGKNEELQLAKAILDSLHIPYYIIPGNHDTGWSESGGVGFTRTFGMDKFVFDHNGIRFIGCASGPYVRMSDGHVPRSALLWLKAILDSTPSKQPVVFLNHYPIDSGLDNWTDVIELLKKKNVIGILCGHGHANKALDFEGIPGVMGRSNLRAKAKTGGYNLVDVTADSIVFRERKHLLNTLPVWTGFSTQLKKTGDSVYKRSSYWDNHRFSFVTEKWRHLSEANVISTPAVIKGLVVFGNQNGDVEALTLNKGTSMWTFKTGAAIYSSPAGSNDKIVFGSADSSVYCLNAKGKLQWKFTTNAAVLGSPVIHGDTVFIGGSDHNFRAIDISSGKQLWAFSGLSGAVVCTPLLYNDLVIFGAWDRYLYALHSNDGTLAWKWTNGSAVINFSPAACTPVVHDGIVYIAAPDRYLTAIDAANGNTVWRTNESGVRESTGMSSDGRLVYGKTMNDTIVAFKTGREKQLEWKLNTGYGYEHVPSMLIEKDGKIFFGTRNGVVYAVRNDGTQLLWTHKIDNSMVNTVSVIDGNTILASTMDGKVVLLEVKQ